MARPAAFGIEPSRSDRGSGGEYQGESFVSVFNSSSFSFVLRPVRDPLSLSSLHFKPPPNPLRICQVWGRFVNSTL